MKHKWLMATVMAVVFAVMFTLLCYGDAQDTDQITSVQLIKSGGEYQLQIKAALTESTIEELKARNENVYLFELYPYQNTAAISTLSPLGKAEGGRQISFTLDFTPESERLYAKFVLAYPLTDGSFTILGAAHYIENPDILAEHNYSYPVYPSKKGLQIQLLSDAQQLNVGQTVLYVPVNEFLLGYGNANAVSYSYGGNTYYINRTKLDMLDYKIKLLTETGVRIYLNIILTPPQSDLSARLANLYASVEDKTASLYALNTQNEMAFKYYAGFLNFLAKRYTEPGGELGFAASFIIGYEINSNRRYHYMGPMPLDNYINSYIQAFRIADTAIRSAYPQAKLYLSLGNNFTAEGGTDIAEPMPTLDYAARDVLEAFSAKIRFSGDIPWNVAVNPYASSLDIRDFRKDALATGSQDTPFITMKNIEVLCDYLAQEKFLYKGERRSILISEFGIPSGMENSDLLSQAALYALAYYKVEFNPYIEGFIYHRHVDNADEGDLLFGLWSRVDGTQLEPKEVKPIYKVFQYIDTGKSAQQSRFALEQLGLENWISMIPSYSEEQLNKRQVIEGAEYDIERLRKGSGTVLFDFKNGNLNGFYPSDNAELLEIRNFSEQAEGGKYLYAKLYSANPTEYMGAGCYFTSPMNIKNSGYISVRLFAQVPEGVGNVPVSAVIRLYSNGINGSPSVVYEGSTHINGGIWTEIAFDISKLSSYESIDGMKVWIKPSDNLYYEGEYGLWLDTVTMYGKGLPVVLDSVLVIILGAALIIVLLLTALLIRYFILKNKRKKRRAGQKKQHGGASGASVPEDAWRRPPR